MKSTNKPDNYRIETLHHQTSINFLRKYASITSQNNLTYKTNRPLSNSLSKDTYNKLFQSKWTNDETKSFLYKINKKQKKKGLLSKFVDKLNTPKPLDLNEDNSILSTSSEGYYLIPGYYDPSTEAGNLRLNMDASFSKYFSRFTESAFVAGPKPEDIDKLIFNAINYFKEGHKVYNDIIEPCLLFITNCDKDVEAALLPQFCFPNGIKIQVTKTNKSNNISNNNSQSNPKNINLFTFLLSNHSSMHQFGVCYTVTKNFNYPNKGISIELQYCLSIITRFPFLSYYYYIIQQFELLGGLELSEPLSIQEEGFPIIPQLKLWNDLIQKLRRLLVPNYNGIEITNDEKSTPNPSNHLMTRHILLHKHKAIEFSFNTVNNYLKIRIDMPLKRDFYQNYFTYRSPVAVDVKYSKLYTPVEEQELERENEISYHTLLWSLPILLAHLPLHQIILAIGCILTEKQIIVYCDDITILSGCILALVNLISPLKWAFPIIVTLPVSLHMLLESPLSIILGILELPDNFQLLPGQIVIKPKERSIDLHTTDIVASHTLQLPRASKLIQEIKPYGDAVIKLNKKSKESVNSKDLNSMFLELDIESESGKQFLIAVAGFSTIMTNHLQAIVNTGIQLAWETKRAQKSSSRRFHNRRASVSALHQSLKRDSPKNSPHRRMTFMESSSNSIISDLTDGSIENYTLNETNSTETDSSLPSVKKDAPILPIRDIGESGLKFLKLFQETQMFNNYCYSKSPRKRLEQEVDEVWDIYKNKEHLLDPIDEDSSLHLAIPKVTSSSTLSSNDKLNKIFTSNLILMDNDIVDDIDCDDNDDFSRQDDPLILLFTIIISRTLPLATKKYDYITDLYRKQDELYTPTITNSSTGQIVIYKSIKDILHLESYQVELETIWCNGKCNGLANTPFCTNICVNLWEEKIRNMKKQLYKRGISDLQLHSGLVLTSSFLPTLLPESEGYLKQSKEISPKGKQDAIRHPKETESQFTLRKNEILQNNNLNSSQTTNTDNNTSITSNNENRLTLDESPLVDNFIDIEALSPLTNSQTPVFSPIHGIDIIDAAMLQSTGIFTPIKESSDGKIDTDISKDYKDINNKKLFYSNDDSAYNTPYTSQFISKQKLKRKINRRQSLSSDWGAIYAPKIDNKTQQTYRRIYASHKASAAVKSIALHYVYKQKDKLRQHIVFALHIIKSFLLITIMKRRFNKLKANCITIQKYFRRWIIKKNLDYLIIQKKFEKLAWKRIIRWFDCNIKLIKNKLLNRSSQEMILSQISNKTYNTLSSNTIDNNLKSNDSDIKRVSKSATLGDMFNNFLHRATHTNNIANNASSNNIISHKSEDNMRPGNFDVTLLNENHSRNYNLYSKSPVPPPRKNNTQFGLNLKSNSDSDKANNNTNVVANSSNNVPSSINHNSLLNDKVIISDLVIDTSKHSISPQRALQKEILLNKDDDDEDDDELQELKGPLKLLGPSAIDAFTPQQRQLILDMWSLLLKGVEVMKHQRKGKPKLRYLYTDLDMTKLFWRKTPYGSNNNSRFSVDGIDKEGNSSAISKNTRDSMSDTRSSADYTKKRNNLFEFNKLDADRELFFKDILQVCDDMSTEVMKRAYSKNYVGTNDLRTSVISIVVVGRTLDFEIAEVYWNQIYHALQVLVNYYRVILPGIEDSNRADAMSLRTDYNRTAYHHKPSRNSNSSISRSNLFLDNKTKINQVLSPLNAPLSNNVLNNKIGDDWDHVDKKVNENNENSEDDDSD